MHRNFLTLVIFLCLALGRAVASTGTFSAAGATGTWHTAVDGSGMTAHWTFSVSVPEDHVFVFAMSAPPSSLEPEDEISGFLWGTSDGGSGLDTDEFDFDGHSVTVYAAMYTVSPVDGARERIANGSFTMTVPSATFQAHVVFRNRGSAFSGTVHVKDDSGELLGDVSITSDVETTANFSYDDNIGPLKFYKVVAGTKVGESFIEGSDEAEAYLGFARLAEIDELSVVPTVYIDVTGPRDAPGDGAKAAWRGTDTTLTAELFREGIDKLEITTHDMAEAMAGPDGGLQKIHDDLTLSDDVMPEMTVTTDYTPVANESGVNAVAAKLPAAPTITMPGSNSSVTFHIPTFVGNTTQTLSIDFGDTEQPWHLAILSFRTILLAGMTVGFFFATVRVIRGSVTSTH